MNLHHYQMLELYDSSPWSQVVQENRLKYARTLSNADIECLVWAELDALAFAHFVPTCLGPLQLLVADQDLHAASTQITKSSDCRLFFGFNPRHVESILLDLSQPKTFPHSVCLETTIAACNRTPDDPDFIFIHPQSQFYFNIQDKSRSLSLVPFPDNIRFPKAIFLLEMRLQADWSTNDLCTASCRGSHWLPPFNFNWDQSQSQSVHPPVAVSDNLEVPSSERPWIIRRPYSSPFLSSRAHGYLRPLRAAPKFRIDLGVGIFLKRPFCFEGRRVLVGGHRRHRLQGDTFGDSGGQDNTPLTFVEMAMNLWRALGPHVLGVLGHIVGCLQVIHDYFAGEDDTPIEDRGLAGENDTEVLDHTNLSSALPSSESTPSLRHIP
ncbi:uncharacterized protein LACBIDRAFT_327553 [Laccaria bicolor S238N-H82]|uniref:Predicted protein n=1 Tax=Laccaria bicolor (strain S238N-H82 / ATCC MYA-4686) TaxID=486041 RepID=B0D644_LACBS|nr:uncharacterized protein LACBIDRAFT_325755 [Laccaria bicolor S238N-H82]XP_001881613.1 uncharacterized protein LACBIDRAFT_327553 [Laccaria bicolor S238N-H82]EDR07824.1 predicted protein [Laccaria bicolor S238N-H82]EDR09878.1 predicted protein [Laccaria bicolor S238N-H82]|eukprot:XP_001879263.1 predicted protein [Laccaria bicolor S238N-H82]